MFAELATALQAEGRDVTILTSRGWALEEDLPSAQFAVHRLGRIAFSLYLRGKFFDRSPGRQSQWLGGAWRDAIMAITARRLRSRQGGTDLVMTSIGSDPWVWAALAGQGRSLIYQFDFPVAEPPRPILVAARRIERHRRRSGGLTRVVVNHEKSLAQFSERVDWLDPVQLPFTGSQSAPPNDDARGRLGLGSYDRLARLFGHFEPNKKDHEVVWRAFQNLAEWKLVIAGGRAADAFELWREDQPDVVNEPILYHGYATDELKQLLYEAADLAVLSFRPGSSLDSGTLVDAISHGLPIVCSEGCFAGDVVSDLGIGGLFVAGDSESLVRTIRAAPRSLDPEVVALARDRTSAHNMAIRHLEALGRGSDSPGWIAEE